LVFSFFPSLTFLFLAGMCFYSTARMPKHPYFRIQTLGLAGFGVVLGLIGLVLFVAPVRLRVQDIYWFSAKVAAFMYLYIWYRGTFPRYRFDQLMKVGWKVLLPMSLGVLILTAMVPILGPIIWQHIQHLL
jgi:NADH-quinone oxidoreductase subunit H